MRDFGSLKVVVLGDLIVDEYITCEPVGMSQEDPTIVVTPIKSDRFIGGAGIVAAHARGLGAAVSYFGVIGRDEAAHYARTKLNDYAVNAHCIEDDSRPTSLKQRFRASDKTLLRVSHLREHAISAQLCDEMLRQMTPLLREADLLVFSDFNYGCLPQSLVARIAAFCATHDTMMVADSQSSSQVGDIARFKGMRLVTPTEREARLALRDFSSGLVVLAQSLQNQAQVQDVFVKLGSEGMLIQSASTPSGIQTDQLPAFNSAPKDVSGAGDSMLITASMALAIGADIWQSAYLGSLAAACQVGKIGNVPLSAAELIAERSPDRDMIALLLAAGMGTRLRPLTEHTPKCMVQIGGKPLLAHWLDSLAPANPQRILINTHYLPEAVRAFVARHPTRDRIGLHHEPALLGTAGTLRVLAHELRGQSLLVAHADNLAAFDLSAFYRRHQTRPAGVHITMLTFDSDTPRSCGIVEETAHGIVSGFHEKVSNPPGRRANGAIYFFAPAVLDFVLATETVADISRDLLPHFIHRTQTWFDPNTYLRDIGTPEALHAAEQEWTVLIRLSHPPTRYSCARFCGIALRIGGRGDIAGDTEQGTECVERIEATVEAKRELVQVRL